MNKELQDLARSLLPKEFKEEVKDIFTEYSNTITKFSAVRSELMNIFGIHNLTSDAEGEEMLTCEKSKVQYRIHYAKEGVEENPDYYNGYAQAIYDLFGFKCLPDGNKECSNPSVVNCKHKHGDGTCSLSGMCCYKSSKPAEMTEERYQYLNSLTIEDYDNETSAEEQRKFCEYQRKYHPDEILWVQTHSDDKEPKPAEPKIFSKEYRLNIAVMQSLLSNLYGFIINGKD